MLDKLIIVLVFLSHEDKQNYKGLMDKIFKIKQTINNPLTHDTDLGIFDIKSYKKAFDQLSASPIQDFMMPKYKKQMSFGEYNSKQHQYVCDLDKKSSLKKEIKPHQTKSAMSKITDIIKNKCKTPQVVKKQKKICNSNYLQMIKQKKTSYSAYLNQRKKMIENESTLALTYSINQHINHLKELSHLKLQSKLQKNEKELIISDDQKLQQTQLKGKDTYYFNNRNNRNHKLRLSGLIIKKKMQPIDVKKQLYNELINHELKMKKANDLHGSPVPNTVRRGFITVKMKHSYQSNLIVSNSNNGKLKAKKMAQSIEPFELFTKNFINQKNIGEEDIQMYPVIEILNIQKRKENAINFEGINSKAITILHFQNNIGKIMYSHNQKEKVQIASITKIMTCYLIIIIADKFCLDIKKEKVIIGQRASKMPGTSAKFSYSDTCTIYELLHGLMLPSGNDAAISLGQWGGKSIRKYSSYLRRMKIGQNNEQNQKSSVFLNSLLKRKSYIRLFIHHMNKLAKFLSLNNTFFVNTHGLMNQKAYSCSHNIALLTYYAMSNDIFKQIVGKSEFKCKIFNRTFSHTKEVLWQNTNKLLSIKGFKGVKTGITPSAGPCLSSLFKIDDNQYLIITLLKTKSCEMRFKQTINILKSILTKLQANINEQFTRKYKRSLINIEKYDNLDYKVNDQEQFQNNYRSEQTYSNEDKSESDENYIEKQLELDKSFF